MKGVMERLQRAYQIHNIQLFCKARYTIRKIRCCTQRKNCVVVYECKCDECKQQYVEEAE